MKTYRITMINDRERTFLITATDWSSALEKSGVKELDPDVVWEIKEVL